MNEVRERRSGIYEVALPNNWKKLNLDEQRQWIKEYFMPKTKIAEPILRRDDKVKSGVLKLESGSKVRFGTQPITVSKRNPNLVRELEGWVGKWLVTVFHNKSFPHVKYLGISNPYRFKWIAQELSSEICTEFYAILMKIRWKYGFFKGKRRKSERKPSVFALSLKDSNRGGDFC